MTELNSVGMPIHPSKTHPLTGLPLEAVYVTRAGKICWPIMGGADDEGGDEGGDGGNEGGDGGDGGAGGLLDDEANNGGGDGGDGGDGSENGSGDGGVDVDDIVDRVTKALEGKFDSIADRRVNAILKETRKQQQKPAEDDKSGATESASGPSDGDIREARLAYREYVGDGIKFLGDVEREHAMTLAKGMIPGLLAQGLDPDEAGKKASETVASQIKSLRKHYESKTLAALKRQGQIADDGQAGQAPRANAGGKPGADSMYKKGQSKAAEMFADRIPAGE